MTEPQSPWAMPAPEAAAPVAPQSPSPDEPQAQSLTLAWRAPKGLIGLSLLNFVLRVVTLGFYGFWARTEVRKRIWSAIRLEGEPLFYTGTGGELCRGFFLAFFAVLVPVIAASTAAVLAFGPEAWPTKAVQATLYIAIVYLTGAGFYSAQRYRASRTLWRGIRGGQTGSVWTYAWAYFWTLLLVPLTLGWILPWRAVKLQGMMLNTATFGDQPFSFSASPRPLYPRFAVLWLVVVALGAVAVFVFGTLATAIALVQEQNGPMRTPEEIVPFAMIIGAVVLFAYLGIQVVSAWYRAHQARYFARQTTYAGATFESTVTARGYIWIGLTNFFIVLLSLGILTPIAQARAMGYFIDNLALQGEVSLSAILQGAKLLHNRGEGLAQVFDFDGF